MNKFLLKILKMIAVASIVAGACFATLASADVTNSFWTKQANGQLYTNSGNGLGNAIINVAGCNGCGGGGGSPASPLTGIQYNNAGNFFADSLATRNPSDNYYTNLATPVRAIKFFDQKGNIVSLRAINYGNSGNSIILTFDGIIDVGTAAANWNAANPSNQVEVIAGSNYVVVLPITSVQLIQGGEASVKIGHTDAFSQLGNTNVSGGSSGIFDGTNLSFIGTAYGDVTQFTGIDGNVLLSGFIDFPNNETSFSLATKDQYTIQFSDSNGISTLNLTGKGFNLSYGTDFGYESDGEFIGFFTPNYNLKFPTTTPNLGDTIQVVSTAGVNYYTNWVPAGGSVTLNQNRIAFGNASNQITWDDGLQYDVTTGKFMTPSFYTNRFLFSNGLGDLNNQVGGAKMQINNRNGIKDYYGGISNSSIVIVPDDDNYNIAVIDYMIEMHPKFTDTFITLPTSPQFGDTYMVKNKEFGTFNVIVGGGGPNIDGSATDTISGSMTVQQSKTYTYNGTEWSIY